MCWIPRKEMEMKSYLIACHILDDGKTHIHLFIPGWRRIFGPIMGFLLDLADVRIISVPEHEVPKWRKGDETN